MDFVDSNTNKYLIVEKNEWYKNEHMGKILLNFPRSVNAHKRHYTKAGRNFKYHQVQPIHSVDDKSYYLAREAR